jgi:hypothetical protein
MAEKPVITRIDLEEIYRNRVVIKKWYQGWDEDHPSAPNIEEELDGYLPIILTEYEKYGYTCEMADATHGRALRGTTTRIDFILSTNGWHIRKYPYGWTAKTQPIEDKLQPESVVQSAIAWCKQQGWVMREWPNGARAFKDKERPVRDASTILSMRRTIEAQYARGDLSSGNMKFYDFAFDY